MVVVEAEVRVELFAGVEVIIGRTARAVQQDAEGIVVVGNCGGIVGRESGYAAGCANQRDRQRCGEELAKESYHRIAVSQRKFKIRTLHNTEPGASIL